MKYTIAFLIALTPFAAKAQFTGSMNQNGTERGLRAPLITVAEAKKMSRDTYATLEGKITDHIKKEYYTFVDDTGSIMMEIEDKYWRGVRVGPNDRVRVYGEVESKTFKENEFEAKSIEIIK